MYCVEKRLDGVLSVCELYNSFTCIAVNVDQVFFPSLNPFVLINNKIFDNVSNIAATFAHHKLPAFVQRKKLTMRMSVPHHTTAATLFKYI